VHHRAVDLTGHRSHSLTALTYAGSNGLKSLWNIQCDCGRIIQMPASEFRKGKTKSCGCQASALISTSRTTHGMSKHPAFAVWRSMNDRCRLPTHQAWKNYGGRGITVCPEWQTSFEAFWADMGSGYWAGLTLERIDNMAGYSAANCAWVTRKENSRNTRLSRLIDTPWGRMTVAEASERSGIGRTTLHYRLNAGAPESTIFSTPDLGTVLSSREVADH